MLQQLPFHLIGHIGSFLGEDDCRTCTEASKLFQHIHALSKRHVLHCNRNTFVDKIRHIRKGCEYLRDIKPLIDTIEFNLNWVGSEYDEFDPALKFGKGACAGISNIKVNLYDAMCTKEVIDYFPRELSAIAIQVARSWAVPKGWLDCIDTRAHISINLSEQNLHVLQCASDMARVKRIHISMGGRASQLDLTHIPYESDATIILKTESTKLSISGANRIEVLDVDSVGFSWARDLDLCRSFKTAKDWYPRQPLKLKSIYIRQPIEYLMWDRDYAWFQLLGALDRGSVDIHISIEDPTVTIPNTIIVPFIGRLANHAATKAVKLTCNTSDTIIVACMIQKLVGLQKSTNVMVCSDRYDLGIPDVQHETCCQLYDRLTCQSFRDAWSLVRYFGAATEETVSRHCSVPIV